MEKYSIKNEVDLLFEKIGKIQEKCGHRFFLLEAFKPKDTLTKGVFRVERGLIACCLDCSKEVEVDMTKMCPRCFGGMISQKRAKVLLINYIVAGYANILFINSSTGRIIF